jgi:hypothetical protein
MTCRILSGWEGGLAPARARHAPRPKAASWTRQFVKGDERGQAHLPDLEVGELSFYQPGSPKTVLMITVNNKNGGRTGNPPYNSIQVTVKAKYGSGVTYSTVGRVRIDCP